MANLKKKKKKHTMVAVFNSILCPSIQKVGRLDPFVASNEDFQELIGRTQLSNLGFRGPPFFFLLSWPSGQRVVIGNHLVRDRSMTGLWKRELLSTATRYDSHQRPSLLPGVTIEKKVLIQGFSIGWMGPKEFSMD